MFLRFGVPAFRVTISIAHNSLVRLMREIKVHEICILLQFHVTRRKIPANVFIIKRN